MRVNDDYKDWNVEEQLNRPGSVLSFWTRALRLRKEHEVLVRPFIPSHIVQSLIHLKVYGDFRLLDEHHETVFAFSRNLGQASAIVLLNFSDREAVISFEHASGEGTEASLLLSNYEDAGAVTKLLPTLNSENSFSAKLRAYEGQIYLL